MPTAPGPASADAPWDLAAPPTPRPAPAAAPAAAGRIRAGPAGLVADLAAPPPPPRRAPWRGPRVALGWERWSLADGFGAGNVDSLLLEGVVRFRRPVRLTLGIDWGLRRYDLGQEDLVGRARAALGWEIPGAFGPLVPHVSVVGSLGLVVGERFSVTRVEALGGGGIELGADLAVVEPLFVGVVVGWQRLRLRDDGYDTFAFRLRVGL